MTAHDLRDRIRAQVTRICRTEVRDDDDLFALGLLSSLDALRLVEALERELGLAICDDDLQIAHFRTVDAMTALAARLVAPS